MFKDTVQRARSQISAGFARNGHPTRLATMLELPMAATGDDQNPPIVLKLFQYLGYFHVARLPLIRPRRLGQMPPNDGVERRGTAQPLAFDSRRVRSNEC